LSREKILRPVGAHRLIVLVGPRLTPGVINIMPLSGQRDMLHVEKIFQSKSSCYKKHYNLYVFKISKYNSLLVMDYD